MPTESAHHAIVTTNNVDAITMFVADPQLSKRFYAKVFGADPIFEDSNSVAFRLSNIVVNLLSETAAGALLAPVTPGSAASGPRYELTVGVESVDETCDRLSALGIALINGPMDRPWGLRTASFADPDGHVWEIAHALSPS